MELADVGAQLRQAGLHARGLAAWAGTERIAALPARLDAAAAAARPQAPAGAVFAWLVAGAEIARGQVRAVSDAALAALVDHGVVVHDGDRLRATVAIVPLGPALMVCDRLDAPVARDLVCWPDDSSHHLATAIPPGRRARWIDLGCGSGFAPLARPQLAAAITGVELNPRAARFARLGAGLSGAAGAAIEVVTGDLGDIELAPAELVTCNPPIPEPAPAAAHLAPELWRRADPGLFDQLWPALRRAVAPGGLIVVHAATDALAALADADGERVIVRYTPDGVRGFGVAWWRPDAPARLVARERALTAARPHLDPGDRDDALA